MAETLPREIDVQAELKADNLPKCSGPIGTWSSCVGGTRTRDGATSFYGEYQNGLLIKGVMTDALHGQITKGRFNPTIGVEGVAEIDFPAEHIRFVGHFLRAMKEGFGVNYFENGQTSEGYYRGGNADGKFIVRNSDGVAILYKTYAYGELVSSIAADESRTARNLPAEIADLPVTVDVAAQVEADHLAACEGTSSTWDNCTGSTRNQAGNLWSGEFSRGEISKGTATIVDAERVLKGSFRNHVLDGIGEIDFAGTRYVGHLAGGKRNGYGILYSDGDQSRFAGNYVNGLKEGVFYSYDANWKVTLSRVFKNDVASKVDANGQVTPEAIQGRYAAACRSYVTAKYTQSGSDVYGHQLRQDVPANFFMTYGAVRRGSFNNHWFVVFSATLDRYVDGRATDRADIPFKYCVFGDNFDVIALDTEERS